MKTISTKNSEIEQLSPCPIRKCFHDSVVAQGEKDHV